MAHHHPHRQHQHHSHWTSSFILFHLHLPSLALLYFGLYRFHLFHFSSSSSSSHHHHHHHLHALDPRLFFLVFACHIHFTMLCISFVRTHLFSLTIEFVNYLYVNTCLSLTVSFLFRPIHSTNLSFCFCINSTLAAKAERHLQSTFCFTHSFAPFDFVSFRKGTAPQRKRRFSPL